MRAVQPPEDIKNRAERCLQQDIGAVICLMEEVSICYNSVVGA